MSADMTETLGELRELLFDIRREAQDTGYGFFVGGDPRSFSPDYESCTPEEVERWRADCALAERGERTAVPPGCHASQPGYGVGTYTIENPQAADWAERLERFIAQLDSVAAETEVA